MSLFDLKDKIKSLAESSGGIKKYYDSRFVEKDIKYTAVVFELLRSEKNNSYFCKFYIKDKTDAQSNNFDKIQSNLLQSFKDFLYTLASYGILDYQNITLYPKVVGLEVVWETNEILIIDRAFSCV